MRKSPYAGMYFNGQGRPINIDDYANTLPASMGGNKTPFSTKNIYMAMPMRIGGKLPSWPFKWNYHA